MEDQCDKEYYRALRKDMAPKTPRYSEHSHVPNRPRRYTDGFEYSADGNGAEPLPSPRIVRTAPSRGRRKGKGKGKGKGGAAMPSTPSRRHLLDSGEGSSLGGWAVNPGTPRRPSTTSARTPRAATTYLPELARKSGRQATGEDHVVSLEQWKPPPVSQLMGKGAKSPRAKKPPSAFPFNNVGAKVSL